jgi:hypothetical protein
MLFTLTGNPNRSLSWLIPDSIHPWVYSSPWRQWQHGRRVRSVLAELPPMASVAASTPLIPPLAQRPLLVRFPHQVAYQDRDGQVRPVDWIVVDLDWMRRYGVAFPKERRNLRNSLKTLAELQDRYAVRRLEDGVVLLQRGAVPDADAQRRLASLIAQHSGREMKR